MSKKKKEEKPLTDKEKHTIKHDGELNLNGLIIPCYVLADGTRVLSGRGMQNALKIGQIGDQKEAEKSGVELARFFQNKWFNSLDLNTLTVEHFEPILCYNGNQKINGYEATVLVDLCDVILQARQDKRIKFTDRQKLIADQCEVLVRAFARVGIIALVDEATGYQNERVKDALEKILNEFLLKEAKPYIGMFPMDFYKEIYRLKGWGWTPENAQKRPGVIGNYTNEVIYERLAPGILKELRKRNPAVAPGRRKHKHFQLLTDEVGDPKLKAHFDGVLALQRASANWSKFISLLNRAFPKYEQQIEIDFDEE